MADTHARSILKALSYRLLASVTMVVAVYLLTRRLALSLSVGALDLLTKLGLYYLHERLWDLVRFGRRPPIPEAGMDDTPGTAGS